MRLGARYTYCDLRCIVVEPVDVYCIYYEHAKRGSTVSGWVQGWIIGAAVVVIVVVLLLLMIRGAARAAGKAEDIFAALEDAQVNTLALWAVDDTNQVATRIVAAATSAREHLASKAVS